MYISTITPAKVEKVFQLSPLLLDKFMDFALCGNLLELEAELFQVCRSFFNSVLQGVITQLHENEAFMSMLKLIGSHKGLSKFSKRQTSLQTRFGDTIEFDSYYAEKSSPDSTANRWLIHDHFQSVHACSPSYVSQVSQLSVLTPSFGIGKEVLNNLGYHSDTEKNRKLSLALGQLALKNRVSNMLGATESVKGKRVVISVDGGRTRIRLYSKQVGKSGKYHEFDTPWIEPKLLVISVIDNDGKVDKRELPIYDACFGDDELFELLADYLTTLGIIDATCIQFIADGALWIWTRVKTVLLNLGVSDEKIIETVDYFHAAEHLNDLVPYLPQENRQQTMQTLKELLWEGNIDEMKAILIKNLPDWEEKPLKPFQYFEKNKERMQYKTYKEQKLLTGSGLVESAIRRVINLRFKAPSAFWDKENLQPMFFLRAAFLAGRWNILMKNLFK